MRKYFFIIKQMNFKNHYLHFYIDLTSIWIFPSLQFHADSFDYWGFHGGFLCFHIDFHPRQDIDWD